MNQSKPHFLGLLAGIFLSASLVLSATVFTRAWMKISEPHTVSVTGSARKNIRSDLVLWHGSFTAEATTLLEAQKKLKEDAAKVEVFLKENSVADFVFTPISISEIHATERTDDTTVQKRVGFKLTQSVNVRSPEVDQVTRLDRDSTLLVERGVLFTTSPLEYVYTKAGDAKIEMLAEATRDARKRAEQIASQGGRILADLRDARMGVFQIGPLYSTQTSWEGMNDTTSLEKTVTAVVTASFSLK